jgi:hypothetical protein
VQKRPRRWLLRIPPARAAVARPHALPVARVSGWVTRAAHAVPLCVLPSGLWRIAVALGVPGIWQRDHLGLAESLYMVVLTVVSEALALLTLGLVRPWGEVLPSWIPLLGGRRVPILTAVVPAAFGALALTSLCAWYFLNAYVFHLHFAPLVGSPQAPSVVVATPARVLLILCYTPLLAWGPLLAIVTAAYYRRRTRHNSRSDVVDNGEELCVLESWGR